MAWIACDRRDAKRAAVLMGAARELTRSIGAPATIFTNLLAYHEEYDQRARRMLGDRAFAAAYRKGEGFGFDVAISYALHEQSSDASASDVDTPTRLTKRERQVADLIAQGLTNQAIADRLVISLRTAQGHVEHILTKLGFTSRTQVAAWVVERTHDRN